ncbi:MAG: murein hydrolase activator EnvC family protein [Solirubrobacterales bacterium]
MNPFENTNLKALSWGAAITLSVTILCLALPMGSSAKTAGQLQGDIARKRAKESALSSDIQSMSSKIQGLRGRIAQLQAKQDKIQVDLDRKAAREHAIAGDLKRSRDRLNWLKARLEHSRNVLSQRIIAVYKAGEPSIVNVILQSHGFAEMVERATYLREIAAQDHQIISTVTVLKAKTHKETVRLASLETEAAQLVAVVKTRRDQVAGAKGELASRRSSLATAVGHRKSKLAVVAKSRRADEEDLDAMSANNGQVMGFLQGGGPSKHGTGQLIYPVNGQFTSPFGYRWGKLHAGIDLAVPVGTPVHAADSGTVRYAGWMDGYGNYTCIQHTSSMSTCYGHQSSIGVRVGESVTKGQVIGKSGNTGHSTGPHVHFEVRINGTPVDPMGYL